MRSIFIASLVVLTIAATAALDRTFSPKSEYVYKFDGHLLSGLPTTSSDASQARISCRAHVQAIDDRHIHLQLTDIIYTASHVPQTEKMPKMDSMELRKLSDEHKDLLELPFRAQIRNGVVFEIQFSTEDNDWSKNTKRSIINLLSHHKSAPVDEMEQVKPEKELEKDKFFFIVPEKTIEGDCQVAYTVVQDGEKTIYTKSVNFGKCITRPETAYGLRFGSECKQCENMVQFVTPQTVYTYTFKNEQLEQSEVHSVYALNVNGEEVAKSETRCKIVLDEVKKINKEIKKANGPKEDIFYSMENEKLIEQFYQQGDNAETNPFKDIPTEQKLEQLEEIFSQVRKHNQNTQQTVHLTARAVQLFRMCTIDELSKIHINIYMKLEKKVQRIIEASLAIAGTKNTIQHLIHNFSKKTFTSLRAAELLKSVQETLYPSEQIADLLIELALSPLAEKDETLRQSAWLASGSVIRGFASKTKDISLSRPATRQLKEKYVRVFMQQLRNSDSTYQKVLALKTLGNAGIDLSIYELAQLVNDPHQLISVRTAAIDALRLLKDVMPRKIQKILLPVYKNRQNKPELRMAALWRIMQTLPEEPVLAHVVSQIENESNQHVAAFTYNVLRQFAKSTNPCYLSLAARCSKALLFTRYQPKEEILSTYAQLPIFLSDIHSGVQFDFATIFEKNAFLPKKMQASVEYVFGGNWNKFLAQVGFSQQNFEKVILKALEKFSSYGKQRDVLRSRRVQSGIQMLQDISKKMNIRQRAYRTDSQNPYADFYLRYKEMDYFVLPLNMETLDNLIDKYVKDGEYDIEAFMHFWNNDSQLELHHALYIYEVERRIPTTMGTPLTISGKMPTVLSLTGSFSVQTENLGVRLMIDVLPSFATTHIIEMRFWSPLLEQGVKSLITARVHTPLKLEMTTALKKNNMEVTHKLIVPTNKQTKVSAHTRPVVFIRVPRNGDTLLAEAEEKTISNTKYHVDCEEIDRQVEVYGINIKTQGNVLSLWSFPIALTTEQDFEYTLESINRPAEFVARFTIGNFQKTDLSQINFEKSFEKEFDLEIENTESRRQYFYNMIREIKSEQGYKNHITFKFEAPQQMYWNTELLTVCDNWIRICKVQLDSSRSPMYHEKKEWALHAELVAARLQMISSFGQVRDQPHREFQLALSAKWGTSKKNDVNVIAQIEQSKEQKEYIESIERGISGFSENELLVKAARLNQISIVSEYNLTAEVESAFKRFFDFIKMRNFWTLSENLAENEENRVFLKLTVDPRSRQYVNITVQTPEQKVEFKNVRMPRVLLPTVARRSFLQQILEKTRSSCKVDQSEVSTFDNVIYRAPLSTCYSLIAKDCSEKPKFAIFAKKINQNTDGLIVRVVRRTEEIVIKKTDKEFLVQIDGKDAQITKLGHDDIEILGDNLAVIRLPQGEVRFDGYTVKTSLPSVASEFQLCGLCGNNDGEKDNEFMTANDYESQDVEEFHSSYILKDEECEDNRAFEKKNYRNKWNKEMEQYFQKESSEDIYETENKAIKKTLIKEFSHRVCFSLEPVIECARGYKADTISHKKIRFTCMPRHSKTAARFLKEIREKNILNLSDFSVSHVEGINIPTTCIAN